MNSKKSAVFCFIASALFFLSAILSFFSSDGSMKIMWLSLGAAFLCIGAANLSKAKKEEAAASE